MRLDRQPTLLGFLISIFTLLDESVLVKYVYPDYGMEIGEEIFIEDINVLYMVDFDVILRMGWLTKHVASIKFGGKKVVLFR
jgi:hypothetical protein